LGRQLRALEVQLESELFVRHARGFTLTAVGQKLVPYAEQMRAAMSEFSIIAAGSHTTLQGDVRLTTSVFMAHHIMPGILAKLRVTTPEIKVDLIASDSSDNLLFREADIAIRMYQPQQLDVITRHLGNIQLGLFASRDYLAHAGCPKTPEELIKHDIVGYDRNDQIIRAMREQGWPATRDWFSTRCDNQTTYWQLVRAGCGIGFCQRSVGLADVNMVELLPDLTLPHLPVWLTAHETLRHQPRISHVWDAILSNLKPLVS
jgi:DNA-binding transcriptional LysR family regulator